MSTESIGPYQLLEELGRGAMGVVFRGFDPAIGRSVAIKIIRADQFATPEEKADLKVRLAREAAAAGKLSHPNIVTVYQLGEQGDLQYLVFELVNGTCLEKTLSSGEPLDQKFAASILSQMADALDYAHSEGIVHRDVKPANILVRADGVAKITDFGIARIASQSVTRTGFTFGTPAYMSPEQIESAKVSARADQYSLGVIAYQMLSGKRPFAAETGPSLMYQIMWEAPPPLETMNSAVAASTALVIAKAMAKKPEDRFASCREFAGRLSESLSAAQADRPANAPATLPTVRTTGPGVPAAVSPPPERLELASAIGPRKPRSRAVLWVAAALAVAALAAAAWVWWHPSVLVPGDTKMNAIDEPKGASPEPVKHVRRAGVTKVNKEDGLTYVWIPPGTFEMGCSPADGECPPDEQPVHQVAISRGFWMGKTEVTQEAWRRLMGTDPSWFKGAKLPVDSVGWDEAKSYCHVAGMRLPTEAEWEYAARAGTSNNLYGDLDRVAWYGGNSGEMTHPVGEKKANPWGLHDMLGNVWEWVEDWYASPYPEGSATDPKGPDSGRTRTLRGGAWGMLSRNARASLRGKPGGGIHPHLIGVRCAGN